MAFNLLVLVEKRGLLLFISKYRQRNARGAFTIDNYRRKFEQTFGICWIRCFKVRVDADWCRLTILWGFWQPAKEKIFSIYTRKNAQLVNKLCSQQACNKLVNKVCSNAVILSSCTKLVTHNLLTSCWLQPDSKLLEQTCNKAVEFIERVASLLQACSNLVNKLGTTSASTSCQQVVATDLLQVCCGFVTSCAFLRV